jgi:hypothetical protein
MENIKETIRNIIKEESEYQQFFRKALEKAGKSIPDMSDEEKKAFFNKIDTAWDGKGEKNEGNAFGAAVTKAKEEGDDEFTVDGKTYPVKESVNEAKVIVYNEKTGERFEVLSGKGKGDLLIAMKALQNVAPSHMKYSIKESINEYDEWKNTRTQSKHIFRMLKQKYNNNISKMRDGLEDILKQNKTKNDQAEVMRDEFNKFFKIKTETVNEVNTIIKSKDGKLHNYPNLKKNDVINFLTKKGMKHVSNEKDLKSNMDFYIVESVNENFSNDDIVKIKGAVEGASSFMGIGSELKKLGMKYDFSTSPLPVYMIKKGSKTFVLVNKKYADKPDFIVNDTAGGLLESNDVNEDKSWKRFLDPYNWFKSKDIFQNRFKNVPSSVVQQLIKLTKQNGDDVETHKTHLWGITPKSAEAGQAVWQYYKRDLYYTNPNFKSTYDTLIPKLVNSKNEVNESKKRFYQQDGVGRAKYTISYHDGVQTHKDGSDFYGIKIFKNKPELENFRQELLKKGYSEDSGYKKESVHEGNAFGMAVTAAKKEGKKEFEFNGKIYKVKKGSYEKNEAAKKAVTENTHVVVSMSKSGYGTLMSNPVSQKDAEKLKKATTPVRGEDLKVISVSDVTALKNKLVGRELLNK